MLVHLQGNCGLRTINVGEPNVSDIKLPNINSSRKKKTVKRKLKTGNRIVSSAWVQINMQLANSALILAITIHMLLNYKGSLDTSCKFPGIARIFVPREEKNRFAFSALWCSIKKCTHTFEGYNTSFVTHSINLVIHSFIHCPLSLEDQL